jgi:hypothetical protein
MWISPNKRTAALAAYRQLGTGEAHVQKGNEGGLS